MKLFESIFGGREVVGRYPDALIEMAIERAVDGTDSRLRLLSGYRKRLRAPVVHALDHVVALVDGIPAPVAAGPGNYCNEPRLGAMFASAEAMQQTFARDRALADYRASPEGQGAEQITALLMAHRQERHVLGMDLVGDQVRRDVAQTTVSFTGHHLLEPRSVENECRRFLRRRAFDHLLALALAQLAEARVERADLTRQRDLLQRKLRTMKGATLSFERPDPDTPDAAALQRELDSVARQLQALGADAGVMKAHLEVVAERLAQAERQLWSEPVSLCLDAMNIRRDPADRAGRVIGLHELQSIGGARATVLTIQIDPRALPAQEDLVTAASRYL